VIENNLFPLLVKILQVEEFDVKKEAAWAVSNATSGGSKEQIRYLVQECKIVKPMCDLLTVKDSKIINVALEALENILNSGEKEQEAHNLHENPYCQVIEEAGGIDRLEELQQHENQEVYDKSVKILEDFFGGEEPTQQQSFSFGNNQNFVPEGGFKF